MDTVMVERRQYTGTQRLQIGWSLGILVLAGVLLTVEQSASIPVSPVAVTLLLSISWLAGLALLGLRERRQWNEMVDRSSFTRQVGPHAADLETIIDGRSVTVSTTVPGLFSQTHTALETSVTGVDASFTVRFERLEACETDTAIGDGDFDRTYHVRGSEQNVSRILTPDVRAALLEIRTPGVCTVTGVSVSYEVPFTSLSPEELETIAEAVVVAASRVEEAGQASS